MKIPIRTNIFESCYNKKNNKKILLDYFILAKIGSIIEILENCFSILIDLMRRDIISEK